MIKYYFGQFFRFLGYATIPGFITTFIRSFILGKALPQISELINNIQSHSATLSSCGLLYATFSLALCPVAFGLYLLIRHSIYKKHEKGAYKKQLSGRHKKDRDLWNDKNWDKP